MQNTEPNTVVVIEFIAVVSGDVVVPSRLSWCVCVSYLSIVRRCWKPHFNKPRETTALAGTATASATMQYLSGAVCCWR